ncbi:sulfatase family protein [Gracilibacillus phocaeensis]|uniref:sulfatase family protein n=1 Tax=Gracilibacillus phocaeensis TaxID=2042304 RepID=UPI001030E1B7|nr:sulfatase [Gracilibacillus phocaeensis]
MRILYIDIDSMRPNHMGAYGYHRNTTPNMDQIARQGTRFSKAYCASSPCVPSRASFASGLFGIHSGVMTHWGPGCDFRYTSDPDRPMFMRLLRQNGYKLTTFSSFADRHDAFWYMAGWNEVHTHSLKKGDENADEVLDAVFPWLDQRGQEEDYFLHIQFWDPHRQYTMPESYATMFEKEAAPAWPDEAEITKQQDSYAPYGARMLFPGSNKSPFSYLPDRIQDRQDFIQFVNTYDGAVRYLDDQLGLLFDKLEQLGIMEDTAIIISADHGEAMGEHSVYGDHTCADEAVHHIPMIIKWPGQTSVNQEYHDLVYNVDLIATICDLLGISVPKKWDGCSFAGLISDSEAYTPREFLVWDHALYSVGRSVRTDKWLLMRTYHPGVVPLEPVELYDMKNDPYMTNNLAPSQPDIVKDLDHLLMEWWHEQVGQPGSAPDPLPLIVESGPYKYIQEQQWADNLREVGREDLRQKYLEATNQNNH